jgi:hypothetical protein
MFETGCGIQNDTETVLLPFGEGGQIKMLYDRRQRPQSVYLNHKLYIVFNAGGEKGATIPAATKPMIVSCDLTSRDFSDALILGPGDKDHHYAPVIWSDASDYLHILFGCHKTPGTHLIARRQSDMGSSLEDWVDGPKVAPGLSYPSVHRIADHGILIYYRTGGHISSWTYRISSDNGRSWSGPEKDVTDLDSKGRFEWSSYHTVLPDQAGQQLHVAFIAYDDNREHDPERYFNVRYQKKVSNEWKYNLYYLKIDLDSQAVTNYRGEAMDLPVDLDQANEKCLIWDTEGRGAGVPPDIVIDENGYPAFLHVLSGSTTEEHHYYFVRLVQGEWKKTVIAASNHQWNSCHINRDQHNTYHAYIVVGDTYIDTEWVEGRRSGGQFETGSNDYLNTGGYMDKHGGGRIEEWISTDKGYTWKKRRDLTPDPKKYPGWRFNNIQPVISDDGSKVEGLLLFYGWKDKNAPHAKAFLLHDRSGK